MSWSESLDKQFMSIVRLREASQRISAAVEED